MVNAGYERRFGKKLNEIKLTNFSRNEKYSEVRKLTNK